MRERNKHFEILAGPIREGLISNRAELESAIAKLGWIITRYGDDYLSIRTQSSRFRFRFDFGDATVKGDVYALIAISSLQEMACYIGCTVNFQRRMEEHYALAYEARFPDGTSSELFAWAKSRKIDVYVAVLEKVLGRSRMYMQERVWTDSARSAGWFLPGSERWASRVARTIASNSEAQWKLRPFDPAKFNNLRLLKEFKAP